MIICLKYKGEKIEIDLKVCNLFEKFSGLMFTKKENARALLFNFGESTNTAIHSYFVFFPFVAIWLDDKDKIIELKFVKPFKFFITPITPFSKLIEIPINKKYNKIIKFLVEDSKKLKK